MRSLTKKLDSAAELYSDALALRAAVQAIPMVGGSLDTLIGGRGTRIQQQRLKAFVEKLSLRLSNFEKHKSQLTEEQLFDLFQIVFENVIKTHQAEKRALFADLVANQVVRGNDFDEMQSTLELLASLNPLDLKVLLVAVKAPICDGAFIGVRAVTILDNNKAFPAKVFPLLLQETFPDLSKNALRLSCSKLLAAGLLHDEGLGRWDTGAFEYFAATDLAHWFVDWLSAYKSAQ